MIIYVHVQYTVFTAVLYVPEACVRAHRTIHYTPTETLSVTDVCSGCYFYSYFPPPSARVAVPPRFFRLQHIRPYVERIMLYEIYHNNPMHTVYQIISCPKYRPLYAWPRFATTPNRAPHRGCSTGPPRVEQYSNNDNFTTTWSCN